MTKEARIHNGEKTVSSINGARKTGLSNQLSWYCSTCVHITFILLVFRCSVMSNSLQPHGFQQTRLPCPSLSPGICTNSGPLSQRCHPTISSPTSLPALNLSQHQGLFQLIVYLHQVAKYWSFNFRITPSK